MWRDWSLQRLIRFYAFQHEGVEPLTRNITLFVTDRVETYDDEAPAEQQVDSLVL